MAKCDVCGKIENMPYHCRHCGGTHCADHRLPENHSCPGLENWDDPGGVFDSGFDDSVANRGGESAGVLSRLRVGTGRGGVMGYFRNNMSYVFLGIFAVVFLAEIIVLRVFNDAQLFFTLFVLRSTHLEFVWTWVTSVFSHSPNGFFHIFGNGIVLYFFGPVLERQIGSKRFTALFLVSGMAAGLGQVLFGLALGDPVSGVLGASGAIMAILGVITVLNPDLRVYLYFLVPVPIWVLTFGYAGLSVIGVLGIGNVLTNVAHLAHLAGLVIGLAYGQRLKARGQSAPGRLQFGRGGGGMGGPGRRF